MCTGGGSVVVLNMGAAANPARFCCLSNRNLPPEKHGLPRVSTYSACARFQFGDGRLGEVRLAVDIHAGIEVRKRTFAAFALDADIPAS